MLYVLIVLAVIALIVFVLIFPFVTVAVHYKNLQLDIKIKHLVFKKNLFIDFSKEKNTKHQEDKKQNTENTSADKKGFDIKSKINNIKDRVYNSETGFDINEVKNLKDEFTESYSDTVKIIRNFLGKTRLKIHIPTIRVKLEYGTGNPANTGIIYGSIWGLVGVLYPIAAMYFHIAYPQMDITPDFYGKRFNIEIKSIIKVRPTHIINAAVTALWAPLLTYFKNKIKKGRDNNGR